MIGCIRQHPLEMTMALRGICSMASFRSVYYPCSAYSCSLHPTLLCVEVEEAWSLYLQCYLTYDHEAQSFGILYTCSEHTCIHFPSLQHWQLFLQPVVVAMSGNVLEYMLSLAYVVGGALLGSPAGAEFLAARDAATQASLHLYSTAFRCFAPASNPTAHATSPRHCCIVLRLPCWNLVAANSNK